MDDQQMKELNYKRMQELKDKILSVEKKLQEKITYGIYVNCTNYFWNSLQFIKKIHTTIISTNPPSVKTFMNLAEESK
tara:strand:- start:170 stop:403 length:234 start_codon:yes stop_codon:yes gene_type:complete